MTRYAMLTDDPERLRQAYGRSDAWSVTSFDSAVAALIWERQARSEGAIVMDSRGWRHGVVFARDTRADGWTARAIRPAV